MSDEILEKKDKFKLILSKIKENSKLLFFLALIIIAIFAIMLFIEKKLYYWTDTVSLLIFTISIFLI